MSTGTEYKNIVRDLGRLEGKTEALEKRVGGMDVHIQRIDTKIDGIIEALNVSRGKNQMGAAFWSRVIAVVTLAVLLAEFLFTYINLTPLK